MTVGMTGPLADRWSRLRLATRFAWAAGIVLLAAALAVGAVVARRIEAAVVRSSAQSTAMFMDAIIAPIAQDLATRDDLGPGPRRALQELFASTPLADRVASYKVWGRGGRIVWAEDAGLVGRTFPVDDDLRAAWGGAVVGSFDSLDEEENRGEAALGLPLLEVYAPIRAVWSGEVIAVAEFYEVATDLRRDLRAARLGAWGAVGGSALLLGGVLYAIVRGGSRTIEEQRAALDARLAEVEELNARNRELRLRVQAAAGRAAAEADRRLKALGADIHDGPAQHLAYAALRLDALRARVAPEAEGEVARVAGAVNDAMAELRSLSRGLQLPDLMDRPLAAVVAAACEAHQARTGHPVALSVACPREPPLGPASRVCVFRFVQEGLSNASRHGGGEGLAVALACEGDEVRASVRDHGPGLPDAPPPGGLGLAGLRDRVESLGGSFEARRHPNGGTELRMVIEGGPA